MSCAESKSSDLQMDSLASWIDSAAAARAMFLNSDWLAPTIKMWSRHQASCPSTRRTRLLSPSQEKVKGIDLTFFHHPSITQALGQSPAQTGVPPCEHCASRVCAAPLNVTVNMQGKGFPWLPLAVLPKGGSTAAYLCFSISALISSGGRRKGILGACNTYRKERFATVIRKPLERVSMRL